ncbi:MAG TPA: hypothetical protein VFZ48_03170 [Candidatus Saccharimonadales bacterium]
MNQISKKALTTGIAAGIAGGVGIGLIVDSFVIGLIAAALVLGGFIFFGRRTNA